MSKVQPTEREARVMLDQLERAIANKRKGIAPEWGDDGAWWVYPKSAQYPHRYRPITSDVSKRCSDCRKVIVLRWNNLVRWQCERNWEEREHITTYYNSERNVVLCTGCSNKRWPATKALIEWNETRLVCNRITRVITKTKKEQTNEQD